MTDQEWHDKLMDMWDAKQLVHKAGGSSASMDEDFFRDIFDTMQAEGMSVDEFEQRVMGRIFPMMMATIEARYNG